MVEVPELVKRLRNGREGWSCDAICIEGEIGMEVASQKPHAWTKCDNMVAACKEDMARLIIESIRALASKESDAL